MFSRPNIQDSVYLIADFIEYQCLLTGNSVSSTDLRSLFSMSNDEFDNDGVESADDISIDCLEDALHECYRRSMKCVGRYPFETSQIELYDNNIAVQFKEIYCFLLLATRLNMRDQKVQSGEDATKLFEEICAEVIKEYLGSHSKSCVFGTASNLGFEDKVKNLIQDLHMYADFKSPQGSTEMQKDGKLDVVAWIPFADNKDGQIVAMGQCKTGNHWEEKLTELQPYNFFNDYCTGRPYADVVRMFFVTESFGDYKWGERSNKGGVVFDRTRIMEFLPSQIPEELLSRIIKWNKGVFEKVRHQFD